MRPPSVAAVAAAAALCGLWATPRPASAFAVIREASGQDTVSLAVLQRRAIASDPRTAEADLQRRATALRLQNLETGLRPQFQLRGDASYQSEVARFPNAMGSGAGFPEPPKERYEATLQTDWTLWDGGIVRAKKEVERTRLTAELAALEVELHAVQMEVADAFFSTLLLQEQVSETTILLEDLEARLDEVRIRVREGVALAADSALLRAELLEARQSRNALRSELAVARTVLERLTGESLGAGTVLALPDLAGAVAGTGPAIATLPAGAPLPLAARLHPQFALFDAQRTKLEQQGAVVRSALRPTLSAFGQLSLGSPGFRQFEDDPHDYWRAGVQVRWAPWNWGSTQRETEELALRESLIATRESAFSERVLRALEQPLRTMAYMQSALESDEEIIDLREAIEFDARQRFAERVIPATTYADARSDVLEARIARARHRTELARAQAHYLITLGVELR